MSSYLGNIPSNNFVSLKRQVITGNGGSSYTLDHSVASVNDVAIFVNNVRQDPASYSISGTALTLGGTISSSDSCYVIFLGQALQTVTPATGTVTNAMLGETITVAKGGTGVTTSADLANTGNLVLLNSQTVSTAVATVSFDNTYFTDNYEYYKILFYKVLPSATNSSLQLEYSIDNGSNFLSSAVNTMRRFSQLDAASVGTENGSGTSFTRLATNISNSASKGIQGEIIFFNIRQSWTKWVNAHTIGQENAQMYQWRVGSFINSTDKINNMRFFFSSGANFTNGRFDLYGVKS
jgi:hypothetical protein